ncbi:hypothetical protein [Nocardia sp. NPDC050793]|uniref:hypothetical protein n=1 Tax=Nocardia sp. NPDC050793 TaxID=3155159 RepID=UPI0033E5090E
MTEPTDRPLDPETDAEFTRRVLERIDAWFDHRLAVDRRVDPHGGTAAPEQHSAADPVMAVIAAELHQLHRARALSTVVTRGGYAHYSVRVQAVHRHHVVLASDTQPGVLLPLRFIESVQRLTAATEQEPSYA